MKYFLIFLFALLFCCLPALGQTRAQISVTNSEREKQLYQNVEEISEAIVKRPNDYNLYFRRALSYAYLKNKSAALEDVRTALSLAPTDNEYTMRLVSGFLNEVLLITEQYQELVKISTEMIEAGISKREFYRIRAGVSVYRLKDYVGGIDDTIALIELNVIDFRDPMYLHEALKSLKNNKNIIFYYEKIFDVFERQIISMATNPPRPTKDEDRNRELAQETLNWLRDHLQLFWVQCAALHEERGETAKSGNLLNKIAVFYPDSDGFRKRANYYQQRGRYAEAVDDLNKVIKYDEENEKLNPLPEVSKADLKFRRAGLLEQRGNLYFLLKQYDLAVADLELSISIDERNDRRRRVLEKIAAARQKMSEVSPP